MRVQDFDFSVDLLESIIWRFNDAEKVQGLILKKQDWIDVNHTDFWAQWFADVFNLQTANDFGLAVWSIILGLPLFIQLGSDNTDKPIWGVAEDDTGDNGNQNFDNGNFANDPNGIILTTEEKRLVLKLRYYQLVTNGAIPGINEFLAFAFEPFGQVYAMDNLDMSMTYVFNYSIAPTLLSVLQQYDILPRPETVNLKYLDGTKPVFGLAEDDTGNNGNQNFDNGNFLE